MYFEQLNPDDCRTYLIGEGEIALVDPTLEYIDLYTERIKKNQLKLTHVIDTHTHADHLSACALLKDLFGCEYVMNENASQGCVTIRVGDEASMVIAGQTLQFIHTPGHTKDSMCIIVDKILMTGDFLFLDDAGGGRDDLPGGDISTHWKSLQKIGNLPDDLTVYPAHEYGGRQPSTLGIQRQRNPHLQQHTEDEFVEYIGDIEMSPAAWMADVIQANIACTTDPQATFIPKDTHACQIVRTIDPSVHDIKVQYIDATELAHLLEKRSGSMVLLDVREKYELTDELGHLKGIIHIPIGSLSQRIAELEPFRAQTIIVICRSGVRSKTGAQILTKAGFENVPVLAGGMLAWRNAGLPVEVQ